MKVKFVKDKEENVTAFTDIRNIVKNQDKKINELASREQIKLLENADKQMQS